jgi:hypothetical protein
VRGFSLACVISPSGSQCRLLPLHVVPIECYSNLITEKSYTSWASLLDGDFLPTIGAKPESRKPSGARVKWGLYRTAVGWLISADCNGAANVIRKVATQLGLNLAKVGRGSLALPQRYGIDVLSKSYRKRCEGALLAPVATSA